MAAVHVEHEDVAVWEQGQGGSVGSMQLGGCKSWLQVVEGMGGLGLLCVGVVGNLSERAGDEA